MILEKTTFTKHLVLIAGAVLVVWGAIQLAFSGIVTLGYFGPGTNYYRIMLMGLGLEGLSSLLTGIFLAFLSKDIGRASEIARKFGIITSGILFVFAVWVLATGPLIIPIVGADPVVKVICGFLVLVPLIRYKYYFNW